MSPEALGAQSDLSIYLAPPNVSIKVAGLSARPCGKLHRSLKNKVFPEFKLEFWGNRKDLEGFMTVYLVLAKKNCKS